MVEVQGVSLEEQERVDALYAWERRLQRQGAVYIAGLDEAGRGPLAGPVTAAAVILPPGLFIAGLNDSKKVPPRKRQELAGTIKKASLAWAVGWASVKEIDCLNILVASRWAMWRALMALPIKPDHVLVDGLKLPGLPVPQTPLVGGDALSASIAAASILAKVARDELMVAYDAVFPGYGLAENKGYPTPEHRRALACLGPTSLHRLSFKNALVVKSRDFHKYGE
ncbi:Ribonuclease HII [Moorella glycerini]|uniref:Ribonuclease HII n=1 Tax=Neomoorella stamsii TaxID=1266720 RepID=A0A9X7J4I2_9FIRM|nr:MULTISPECIES: ribonuclease HII [Moorella]PRR76063.1 Ribonuclease HII [Moorella stamsii]CEP68331.1 Ribonuclease HII [Moorella glycerini]